MKTFEQLQKEWGDSTCGRSIERFIYDYFEAERPKAWNDGYATAIANEAKLDKERSNKVIDDVINYLGSQVQHGYFEAYWKNMKKGLEELKHKQP